MTQSAKKNEELEVPSGGIGAFAMSEDDVKAIQEAEAEQEFGTQGLGQFSAVAKRMAGYGRFGDDSIAHVQTGEIIIPLALIENNSKLKEQIFQSFRDQGIQDPERYVVGSGGNYINPETGQMEFFGPGWVKAWNKVKGVLGTVVKIALPLALAATPLGPIYGAAMGSGIATLLTGGTVKEALNSALVSGATGAVMVGVSGGGLEGVGKALKDPVSRVSQTAKGAFNGDTKLFRSFVPKEETAGTLERLGGKADAKIGETFFPEDVTPDQVLQRGTNPIDPMAATPTQWDRAKTIAKQESPGMIRKTAPLVLAATAVVGGAASLGAFDEEEPEGIIEKDSEGNAITGQDLIDANPEKYTIELPDYTTFDYSNSTVPTNYPGSADTVATDTIATDLTAPVVPTATDTAETLVVDPITGEPIPQTPVPYNRYSDYVMSSTPTGPFALPQIAQMAGGGPVQYFAGGGKVQYFADGGETQVDVSGSAGYRPAVDTTKPAAPKKKKKNKNPNREAAYAKAIQDAIAKKEQEKADKLASEKLAEQQENDRRAAEIQAAVDKALEDKAAADAIADQKAEKERLEQQQIIDDQAAKDKAAKDQAAKDQAAKDQAAKDQAAKDQAAIDQAAADQAAIDQAAADQAAIDQLAADQAAADLLASERLAAQAAADQAAEDQAAKVAQDKADRIAAAQVEADRIAAEEAEAARIAQENFAVNYAANNPVNVPRQAPAPIGTGVYNPRQDAQTLADSSAAPYQAPMAANANTVPDPLAVDDTFGLDSYADYSQIIDPYTAIDFTVPTVTAPTVQPNDFTLYSDNPFYTAPVGLADGGPIFPRREGGIAPTEGTPGKDSVRAMLMPGEFIMTTDAVKGLGNGNNEKGIQNMYAVMRNLENRGRNT